MTEEEKKEFEEFLKWKKEQTEKESKAVPEQSTVPAEENNANVVNDETKTGNGWKD